MADHRRTHSSPQMSSPPKSSPPMISVMDTTRGFQEPMEEVHLDEDPYGFPSPDTPPPHHSPPHYSPNKTSTTTNTHASRSSGSTTQPTPRPGPTWHDHPSTSHNHAFPHGRVLVINYVSCAEPSAPASSILPHALPLPLPLGPLHQHLHQHHAQSQAQSQKLKHKRRVVAQECDSLASLQHFFALKERPGQPAALRVIHVQNAPWATKWLLQKFNIGGPVGPASAGNENGTVHGNGHGGGRGGGGDQDGMGAAFGRWARFAEPQRRAGKPVLNGRTFSGQRDPWRGVRRGGFGLDYLRCYGAGAAQGWDEGGKMMELNGYDDREEPGYSWDAFAQRCSVYVQRREGEAELEGGSEREGSGSGSGNGFSSSETTDDGGRGKVVKREYANGVKANEEFMEKVKGFDNGNAVIVFEHSQSGSIDETLIGSRGEIELRWRRLLFYLHRDQIRTDDNLAAECIDYILKDVFHALAISWEKYLRACETHVSILEDKIYDDPADESRAPELWTNSFLWLKVEKLMYLHIDIIREVRAMMKDFMFERDKDEEWLSGTPEDFDRLATSIQEDLVKPTGNLSDMMYKSVEIRDSRQSLHLGASMWRLSWITFVFLPLTFIVGFFGMNVDTFASDPSIKWYFISAVPVMALVFLFWYLFKHVPISPRDGGDATGAGEGAGRRARLQRGVYEGIYHEFAAARPDLWSRAGPRDSVRPQGVRSGVKWRLMLRWFAPERTVRPPRRAADPMAGVGVWERYKQRLVRRWLGEIAVSGGMGSSAAAAMVQGEGEEMVDLETGLAMGAVGRLAQFSYPVAVAKAEPAAAAVVKGQLERLRSSGSGRARPESTGSGVLVEEKTDDEGSNASDGEGREARREARALRGSRTSRGSRRGSMGVRAEPRASSDSAIDRLSVPAVEPAL